tara:strand:+ start:3372 stop:3659 length:288 start_codon:yes stop_codon:yes gene_type:complete
MPAVTRIEDLCTGHGCYPPRKCIKGSSNVFVNSKAVHRKGDVWDLHGCGGSKHGGVTSVGSSSVYVNGKPIARKGDPISCGSAIFESSTNVSAGG